MSGPCLCGDTQCPSCGPAQGNWRCPICRAWQDDGCIHFNEDGTANPNFMTELARIAQAESEADALFAAELEENDA